MEGEPRRPVALKGTSTCGLGKKGIMTRRAAIEVGLVLLSFYAFLSAVATIPVFLFSGGRLWTLGWFLDFLKSLVPGAALVAFGWGIIAYRRGISERFFPRTDGEDEAAVQADWQEPAYRLGFTMLGVLVLSRWVPRAFVTLMMILDSLRATKSKVFPHGPFERMTQRDWQGLLVSTATFTLGVFLLLGAPKLRTWLLERAQLDTAGASERAGDGGGNTADKEQTS